MGFAGGNSYAHPDNGRDGSDAPHEPRHTNSIARLPL
jgi:hypothetical protein